MEEVEMDEPVYGRHAAIYAVPERRLPKSFYLAAAIAALAHIGLGWYLIHQTFLAPPAERFHEGPPITIETYKPQKPDLKPDTPKPAKTPPPPIHDAKPDDTVKDPLPVPPQPNGAQSSAPPKDLPKDVAPPAPPTTDTTNTPTVITARWAQFPDADALASYYPSKAANDEIEGSATVQCTVVDASGRVSCVAVAGSPPHYGFDAATVRMVQDKGRVDTSQGTAPVGSILRQTVRWRLN
jgi:protein TonB